MKRLFPRTRHAHVLQGPRARRRLHRRADVRRPRKHSQGPCALRPRRCFRRPRALHLRRCFQGPYPRRRLRSRLSARLPLIGEAQVEAEPFLVAPCSRPIGATKAAPCSRHAREIAPAAPRLATGHAPVAPAPPFLPKDAPKPAATPFARIEPAPLGVALGSTRVARLSRTRATRPPPPLAGIRTPRPRGS